ncbi:MAG: metallophosphoesterase [Planctomycetes bacterium]|nr:metallophosphoesterase [Planctomycetota bacterium]
MVFSLVRRADRFLTEHPELVALARANAARGFQSGGEWMVAALQCIRKANVVSCDTRFARAGTLKYAACTLLGILCAALAYHVATWLAAPGFVLGFYALEARLVFLFPVMIDDGVRAWASTGRWVVAAGGVLRSMSIVLPLAIVMLTGGFLGRGFVRSWLLGCTAVLLWYEDLRDSGVEPVPRRGSLDVGARAPLLVRRETIDVLAKDGRPHQCVLFASDLHLGALGTGHLVDELVGIARAERPDLILIGGDLVDGKRGLVPLERLLTAWSRMAPTLVVPGNHDRWAGIDRVRMAVERAGGHWLLRRSYRAEGVCVDGALVQGKAVGWKLLCTHEPRAFEASVRAGYDVVFAGHLHGGQAVLFERCGRLYPGAWLHRWNGIRFEQGGGCLIVSRGAADTLPVRWRCPREVVVCSLRPRLPTLARWTAPSHAAATTSAPSSSPAPAS